ncbi:MAG: thioredoxin family protein [Saprospiraceae bacterium]
MNKLLSFVFIIGLLTAFCAFTHTHPQAVTVTPESSAAEVEDIKWYTFEEAVEMNKTQPKKFLVDVYTDWCGWCKVMDKKTFTDNKVKAYVNEHFYAVKLDAEQKEAIQFNDNKFEFIANAGKRGIHTLAYSLLDGKMSYPSIVYLNEKFERIAIAPGYKTPEQIMGDLTFAAEEQYKN